MLCLTHRQAGPPCCQCGPEFTVRKKRDIPLHRAETCDQPIRAVGDLRGHLTPWAAVAKHIPVRPLLADIRGELALVVAIVPLSQARFNFCVPIWPDQRAGPLRALPRAGQHETEMDASEPRRQFARFILAVRGQWDVRAAGVTTGKRPIGFAVPDEVQA